MSRLLIDPALPTGPKLATASDTAKLLHFLGLCYAASALSDGFVPEGVARKLTQASYRQFTQAIEHLSTVQPGCAHPSWERRDGGWFLHDYDDPLYRNPMRSGRKTHEDKQRAGAEGGKKSVQTRLERYGTAQPLTSPTEADPEAPNISASKQAPEADPPEGLKLPSSRLPSSPFVLSGDKAIQEGNGAPAHPWARVSRATLIGHVGGWFLDFKQWRDIKPQTRVDLEADATAMVDLGIPGDQLHAILVGLATKRDPDDVNRLSYFWQPVQDEQHARTKQQAGSHARTDEGITRIKPTIPAA
jgi:hypothetical protein